MDYPGRVVAADSSDADGVLTAIRQELDRQGYLADARPGVDPATAFTSAVKYYQATHADSAGRPLKVDGIVGPNTWSALFGATTVADGPSLKALAFAETQVGVREQPRNSNSGPEVDRYLASVGDKPGLAWCMAFVHYCFDQAVGAANNPLPKSGGVLDVYRRVQQHTPNAILLKADAVADPSKVKPGLVFIQDHGGGLGHCGFVMTSQGAALTTVEGNTNDGLSRDGDGVYEQTRRSVTDDELVGFLQLG